MCRNQDLHVGLFFLFVYFFVTNVIIITKNNYLIHENREGFNQNICTQNMTKKHATGKQYALK